MCQEADNFYIEKLMWLMHSTLPRCRDAEILLFIRPTSILSAMKKIVKLLNIAADSRQFHLLLGCRSEDSLNFIDFLILPRNVSQVARRRGQKSASDSFNLQLTPRCASDHFEVEIYNANLRRKYAKLWLTSITMRPMACPPTSMSKKTRGLILLAKYFSEFSYRTTQIYLNSVQLDEKMYITMCTLRNRVRGKDERCCLAVYESSVW